MWLQDLGPGDLDYRRVAEILRQESYRGTLTVELAYERRTTRTRSIEENLRQSRRFVIRRSAQFSARSRSDPRRSRT